MSQKIRQEKSFELYQVLFTINHFVYSKTKNLKKTVLSRLKIKTIFFIYIHDLQAQNSLVN